MALHCEALCNHNLPALTPLQQGYYVGANPRLPLHARAIYYAALELPYCEPARLEKSLQILSERHDVFLLALDESGQFRLRERPAIPLLEKQILPSDTGQRAIEQALARRQAYILDGDWAQTQGSPLIVSLITTPNGSTHLQFGFQLIYFDGPSLRTFFQELDCLYRDPGHRFPQPAPSYLSLLRTIATDRDGKRYARAREYWQRKLDDLPDGPDLPLAVRDLSASPARLTRRTFRFPKEAFNQLLNIAEQRSISPAALLLTLYSHVVCTWATQRHFLISMMTQAFRSRHPEARKAVGNLSSMLPIEVDFRTPATLAEKASALSKALTGSLLYSDACGIEVLKWKNRRDGVVSRPASPVAFVADLQNTPENERFPYFSSEPDRLSESALRTPQVLIDHQAITTSDGGLQLNWDAAEEHLAAGVARTMFECYRELILRVIADPSLLDKQHVELLPSTELISRRLANSETAPVDTRLLHELFFDRALSEPDSVAIVDGDQTFTYGQLSRLALQLSGRLRDKGVAEGDRVALLLNKGWRQIVAVLAVLNCRAAYVPLDPAFPSARISAIVDTSDPKVILAESPTTELPRRPLLIGELLEAPGPEAQIVRGGNSDRLLAYVIFTSGSTGTPKGVMLNHQGPVNTIKEVNRRFSVSHTDRVIALSALNFDLSVWDIFGTFEAGATLVFPKHGPSPTPAYWLETVEEQNVTVWNSAPALLQMAVEYARSHDYSASTRMRLVMVSGDWVPTDLPGKVADIGWDVSFVALGGATEASIWSNFHIVREIPSHWTSIPYGRPLANQYFHVLDEALEHRPIFVTGELYIGGLGVAVGYLGQRKLTEASFIHHPETGERLYRTGDLGRYLQNGEIEFIGRRDQQVKIQGYRIELGDVEAAITRHPKVQSAVVIPIGKPGEARSLCAYIVIEEGTEPNKRELTAFLHELLPRYMVPPVLIYIDHIPLSRNGKVDRKQLPSPSSESTSPSSSNRIEGDIEKTIASVWENILHLPITRMDDDFFRNGGDSLSAVLMSVDIAEKLGIEVPLSVLPQCSTVASLAEYVHENKQVAEIKRQRLLTHMCGDKENPPLFPIHPAGGTTLCYAELASMLGSTYSVYAIQAAGTLPGVDPINDVRTMAADYLREVRRIAQGKPFIVGGWSFGGVVAAAMVALSRAEAVPIVGTVMIDSPTPCHELNYTEEQVLAWFFYDLFGSDAPLQRETHSENSKSDEVVPSDSLFETYLRHAQNEQRLPAGANTSMVKQLYKTFRANLAALNSHQPEIIQDGYRHLICNLNP